MNIGVNLGFLRPTFLGGSEVYVRELIPCLARLPGTHVTVFCWEQTAPSFAGNSALDVVAIASGPFSQTRRLIAENLFLTRALRRTPVDVMFSPGNFAAILLASRVPQVATIHDLQHVHFPQYFSAGQRAFRSALFRATFRRCRRIIAVSEFTRRDILTVYGMSANRVATVHEGVTHAQPPTLAAREAVRARYGLPETYFYYPAAFGAHKNHRVLLDALQAVVAQSGRDVHLALSGDKTERYAEFERTLRRLGLAERVRHLGFLPREDLFPVLASSSGLVFPSLFEGFGLPILEAMQCGVPVIAANTASIPEVAGDAAILLPPDDAGAWAAAMATVLSDEQRRRNLIERGRVNVRRFSWERCAQQTYGILEAVAQG